jgi:isocitrate dehydrogenase
MGDIDLAAKEQERITAIEKDRQEREARRVEHPFEEMEVSGRTPTTVGDIMTRMPITVKSGTRVNDAMRVMREHGISSVLIEPGDDGLWAIMTQRDIVSRIVHANRSPANVVCDEIATKPLITVPVDMSLYDCSSQMLESNIRRVVVAQNNVPIGIVSDTDLFRNVEEFGWLPE